MRSIIIACLLTAGQWSGTRAQAPGFKGYLDAMKLLSRDCAMTYAATCFYPDKTEFPIRGRLAIQGGDYYDSSNLRFILKNKSWLVSADHQTKILNVVYLPELEKQYGSALDVDISAYLLSDSRIEDYNDFKVKPHGKDSFTVRLKYKFGVNQLIDITLYYKKGVMLPGRYTGEIWYPLSDEDNGAPPAPNESIRIAFECRDIRPKAEPALFKTDRLIQVSGKRAQMKRYNKYKIYRRAA